MTIAQSGQYNLGRCIKREDQFAIRYAETKFCIDVISLIFLINRRYTPFYKWMNKALVALPRLGKEIHEKINLLIQTLDSSLKLEIVEEICSMIIAELKAEDLTDSSSTFLLDHGPIIQSKIKDEKLRERNVWIG
jgi:gamma-glutamylcysteine synthetase